MFKFNVFQYMRYRLCNRISKLWCSCKCISSSECKFFRLPSESIKYSLFFIIFTPMKTPNSLYSRLALITSITLVVGYFVVYAWTTINPVSG